MQPEKELVHRASSLRYDGTPTMGPSAAGELPALSPARLIALTVGLLGLQFCWAAQVGNATKTLLELGLSQTLVAYAWLAGPIAGIIMQPLVGAWSDRCTSRLGRRRPFLIVGSAVTVVCLFCFAFAREVGAALGDNVARVRRPRALVIAVASFWALDFALNAAQGPLRALLADRVPKRQHAQANSYFALMTGLGNLLGSLAGSVRLTRALPFFPEDLAALYALAALALVLTMGVTVAFTQEVPLPVGAGGTQQYESLADGAEEQPRGTLRTLWDAVAVAPQPFHRVFTVQCCTWFSWFTMFVFGTSWVGSGVYGGTAAAMTGTPARLRYDAGVRAGNLGLALQSVVTVLVSLWIPRALRVLGERGVYVLSHAVLGIALLSTLRVQSSAFAVALFATTGIPWAITMALPWALMGQGVSKHAPGKEGVYFTLFNLSQCFPEVVVSVVAPAIVKAAHGRQAVVLASGGVIALVGGAAIIALGVGDEKDDADDAVSPVRHAAT